MTSDKGLMTFIAFCLLPFAILTSCSPSRAWVVSASAMTGYCPVCKMSVKASSDWTAEIYYNDGTKLMFESPGDMLSFYIAPEKYIVPEKQKNNANITKILVKDYQSKNQIDARQSSLVYNSSIKSDMGPELVPLATREAAEEVAAKNGGTIISWNDVTSEVVHNLRK